MTRQSTVDKPKTSFRSHQPLPVCALRKLAGFADESTSVAPTQTQTRDTPLVPFNEKGTGSLVVGSGSSSSATGATAKTRSRPSNEYVLYAYGEPVAVSADGNASYFGTDILGSIRNTTDKYGNVQSEYNYDVFGSPYLGNLDHDIGFGYCGKIYDNGTGLYDYGFRDYAPNQARFTTIDPIRDGANWFSYVVNDPVNYVDPFGLTATDVENYTYQGERDGRRYYTAKPEATMWGLANDTGTDLGDVQGYDGDPHKMPIGTELSIPAPSSGTTPTESTQAVATPTTQTQSQTSTPQSTVSTPVAPTPTVPAPSSSAPAVSTGGARTLIFIQNNRNDNPTIDSSTAAVLHYYFGKGKAVNLGPRTINALINSPEHQYNRNALKNYTAQSKTHRYSVNLKNSDGTFHVGKTVVTYDICDDNPNYRVVTYHAFVDDGFWDITGEEDGNGPKKELGGTPYSYIPFSWTEVYIRN